MYGGKGIRSLTPIIVQSEADAQCHRAAGARAGQGLGPTAATLANKTRDQIADISDAVAAAAFGAKEGDVVGPIHSDLGWHVIKIDKISNTPGTPLSAVRGEIAAKLTADKRKEALTDIVTKVEDSIADGASFAEAVKAAGLTSERTPAITGQRHRAPQPGYKLPPELAPAVRAGFELGEGDEPVVETLAGDAGYALVAVDSVIGAAPGAARRRSATRSLTTGWASRRATRPAPTATAIAAKIDKGGDMAAAMADAGVKLPPPAEDRQAAHRIVAVPGQGAAARMGMMFSLSAGPQPDWSPIRKGRGFVIVKMLKIIPGNASPQPSLISGRKPSSSRRPERTWRADAQAIEARSASSATKRRSRRPRSGSPAAGNGWRRPCRSSRDR